MLPVIQPVKALKETQSTDFHHWHGLILSSSYSALLAERVLILLSILAVRYQCLLVYLRNKNICCMLAAEVDSSVCRVLTCHFQW